jgi:hypothetical protein
MKCHSLALLVLGSSLLSATAQEVRQWTDKASGNKIEASMVSADPTARTVTIQRKDGQSFTLPVDRLVDADLVYIKQQMTAPKAPAAAPAPGAPPAAPTAPVAAAPAAPAGGPAPARPVVTVIPVKKFKAPGGSAILGTIKKERPRLLMNAAGFAALKNRASSDPLTKNLLAGLKATAEKIVELPELVQVRGEAAANNNPGAKCIFRMSTLGTLNYVDGDPRWKDYAVRELISMSTFTNWHPGEMSFCAQFVWGMSIGYDMFRSSMNPDQAARIKKAIIELGVDALMANFKGDPLPVTTTRPEPGQAPPSKADPKTARAIVEGREPDAEEMTAAGALLLAAIALADEEPSVAGPAANQAMKVFGEGITRFAPSGIWPDGVYAGDEVLDVTAAVVMTLRAATGNDFGIPFVEGVPQAGFARMHLTGTAGGNIFNYGDSQGGTLTRNWVTSFLAAFHGNPGVPALRSNGAALSPETSGMSLAGQLLYHSPHMGGYGTPEATDTAFAGEQVATLRSGWNDPKAMFVGIKGGDNGRMTGQLDLGTFVLDAGGVRWGIDLGTESDRVLKNHYDPKKFEMYREGTFGQNTWQFAGPPVDDDKKKKAPAKKGAVPDAPKGCQPLDATAEIVGFASTPERGVAIVDLSDAYSRYAKELKRGIMLVRGASPYVIMQDELNLKGGEPTWVMHTKATVAVAGNKATLTSANSKLTATILSPAGATFTTGEIDEKIWKANEQIGGFKGITVLKVGLQGKGEQSLTIVFTQADTAPTVPVTTLEGWLPKKR